MCCNSRNFFNGPNYARDLVSKYKLHNSSYWKSTYCNPEGFSQV